MLGYGSVADFNRFEAVPRQRQAVQGSTRQCHAVQGSTRQYKAVSSYTCRAMFGLKPSAMATTPLGLSLFHERFSSCNTMLICIEQGKQCAGLYPLISKVIEATRQAKGSLGCSELSTRSDGRVKSCLSTSGIWDLMADWGTRVQGLIAQTIPPSSRFLLLPQRQGLQ